MLITSKNLGISNFLKPIPDLEIGEKVAWETGAWKDEKIDYGHAFSGGGVVAVNECLLTRSVYFEEGKKGASEVVWLRPDVLVRLMRANETLRPFGLQVLVRDGWRSEDTQQDLFDEYLESLRVKNPGLSEAKLRLMTQRFVSLPSRDRSRPSPHLTGGAVDFTLADMEERPLDMGCEFDEFGQVAATRYFEDLSRVRELRPDQGRRLMNRRLQYWVARSVGLVNCPHETWHWSKGDQMAAMVSGERAVYGPIWPGGRVERVS